MTDALFKFTPRFEGTENLRYALRDLIENEDFFKFLKENEGKEFVLELREAVKYTDKEKMYAYYHHVVLAAAIRGFTKAGYEYMDKIKADYLLKSECAVATMVKNGKEEPYLEDKARMSKTRLYKFIADCILFIEKELQIEVVGSDEFKNMQVYGKPLRSLKNIKPNTEFL